MKKIFMFVNIDWFFLSHRLPIAKAAKLNNVDMSVYTDFSKQDKLSDDQGFDLIQSPITRSSKFFGFVIIEFIKAYLLILKEKPDLVHAVTIKPIILLGIVTRLTRTPFVGSISGLGPVFNQINLSQKIRFKLVLLIYKFIYSTNSSTIICQSAHDKNLLLKFRVCSESRISIIRGSGVNLEKFKPASSKNDNHNVLMASRILSDKGVKEFCASAKQFRNLDDRGIKFRLAGPIDELSPTSISEEELKFVCADSEVEYLGNRTDINSLLASASIFILPSYYPEGVPKVLLEAASCGTPVITTDHPGCRDAIINNKTGILVEPRNSEAITKAILFMLDNPKTLDKMAKASRKLAEDYFDEKKVVEEHYKIYQQYS
tara:strand:- start:4200 stop:5321 length:1122 start_codon:yes stop_codon:yes gene_type:complete